jgi:hypothetical protein
MQNKAKTTNNLARASITSSFSYAGLLVRPTIGATLRGTTTTFTSASTAYSLPVRLQFQAKSTMGANGTDRTFRFTNAVFLP